MLKLRVRRTLGLALLVAGLAATVAQASSGLQCANSGQYGSSCIEITGSKLTVRDVQAYFTPPNNDYLSGRRWAMRLTEYGCNPIHKSTQQCEPAGTWYTKLRSGNPPQQGSDCASVGADGFSYQQCRSFGLAYADANFRDWGGFPRMAHTFSHDVWLCSDVAVRAGGAWHTNGAAGTPGVRGCAQVHG